MIYMHNNTIKQFYQSFEQKELIINCEKVIELKKYILFFLIIECDIKCVL